MKPLLFGAFEINQVNLTSQGLWAHPAQSTHKYKHLAYWTDLARLLERSHFDFLFLADSYGYPVLHGETPAITFEQAVELPKNDPMLLIPALSAVTESLCYVVTTSTSFEQPYANARRFATLDHLTQGRVGWNVVTTSSAVVSDLFGSKQAPHDERYVMAQDFLDLSYKLFEGSWEDGSVLVDKARRIYADPARIHRIAHDGPFFRSNGYFNCEPSPQRVPLLVQAGASTAGRAFAAANAELVFVQGRDVTMLREQADDIRQRVGAAGRELDTVKLIAGLSLVSAASRSEASEKLEEYLSWVNPEAARAYYAMMTGIDLSRLDPGSSLSAVKTEGGQTQVERYRGMTAAAATADFVRRGMREIILVGTPADVAEQIAEVAHGTGLDGFNFTPFISPQCYREFGERVVPELQRMGLVSAPPSGRTFRERIFGLDKPHLPHSHPAARYRVGRPAPIESDAPP